MKTNVLMIVPWVTLRILRDLWLLVQIVRRVVRLVRVLVIVQLVLMDILCPEVTVTVLLEHFCLMDIVRLIVLNITSEIQ